VSRPIVLDASAGVPLVHVEPESPRWRSLTDRWLRDGRRIVVPSHFWPEVTNALVRRHGYRGDAVLNAIHLLDGLVSETYDLTRSTLLVALDYAERFGLTVYDGGYLALSEVVDAELATMDRALEVAAADRLADRTTGRHRLSESRTPYGDEGPVTWPSYAGAARYLAELRADLKRQAARAEAARPTTARS
jgi:predicted nucleic acid-binding protein